MFQEYRDECIQHLGPEGPTPYAGTSKAVQLDPAMVAAYERHNHWKFKTTNGRWTMVLPIVRSPDIIGGMVLSYHMQFVSQRAIEYFPMIVEKDMVSEFTSGRPVDQFDESIIGMPRVLSAGDRHYSAAGKVYVDTTPSAGNNFRYFAGGFVLGGGNQAEVYCNISLRLHHHEPQSFNPLK